MTSVGLLSLRRRDLAPAQPGKRLRPRAALTFLLVALVPVALGGWLLNSWIVNRQEDRVDSRLRLALQGGLGDLAVRVSAGERHAAAVASTEAVQQAMLERNAKALARVAYAAGVTITVGNEPLPAAARPELRRVAVVLRHGKPLGRVALSIPLDRRLLASLRADAPLLADEGFVLVQDGRVAAGPAAAVGSPLAVTRPDVILAGGRYRAASADFVAGRRGVRLVALAPRAAIDAPVARLRRTLLFALGGTLGTLVLLGAALGQPLLRRVDELAQSARRAVVDELTGLANRRAFREAADAELRRCARLGTPCTVVLVDVDRFKQVNDTHGHAAGDDVLRLVAEVLRGQAREIDLPARYGGEEFAILLRGTDESGGRAIAERVRVALAAAEAATDAGPLRVTASFGVAAFPRATSLDGLLAEADAALYRAKEDGRDRVVVAADAVGV